MLLSGRMVRLVFEGAEDVGLAREDLVRPLGVTLTAFSERTLIEWGTFAAIVDELSRQLTRDVARVRDVGRHMVHVAASDDGLRRAAQGVASARALYALADRWLIPANFPGLRVFLRFAADRRILLHFGIPEPCAPSEYFLHLFEGTAMALPELIGLPASIVMERSITPRTSDLVLELPETGPFRHGARRAARAVKGRRAIRAALEQQRERLSETLEALKGAREELRALLDGLPDLVVVYARDAIIWANRASVAALGFHDVSEMAGMPLLETVAPRSYEIARERSNARDAETWPALTEIVLKGRSGQEVVVEVAPAQTVVFDGVPARLVVGRDVTERMRMQQQLLVADRLASVGLLAAGVAHEVNNPLAYVLNNVEMARKAIAALGDGIDVDEDLGASLDGVDRIRSIVQDLRVLSRGDRAPEEALDVRAVADWALALAAQEIDRTARLQKDFGQCPVVRASAPRIAQILLNLIGCALDTMRGRPRAENELLIRIASGDDDHLLLEVSDSGGGAPDVAPDDGFGPFHGRTVGLVVAQQLVTEIGGEISVARVESRGTTRRVLLPAGGRDR